MNMNLPYLIKELVLFTACGVFLGILGCSPRLTPLRESLRTEQGWGERDLSQIQFYLSEDLTLYRQRRDGRTLIEGGRVRLRDGREVVEYVFERGTPGLVLQQREGGRLAVGFEADESRFLIFGPNRKRDGLYTLLAKEWDRNEGTLTYAGQDWKVNARDADVHLQLDLRRSGQTKVKRGKASGRRL